MCGHCKFGSSAFIVVQPTLCNGLLFCVKAHGFRAMGVVVSHEALFPPTETVESHRNGDRHVHTDHSNLNAMRKFSRYLTIPREDGRAITIFMLVDQPSCAAEM